jgi:hypothetical protein
MGNRILQPMLALREKRLALQHPAAIGGRSGCSTIQAETNLRWCADQQFEVQTLEP